MHERVVVHAMLTVETDGRGIVLTEQVVSVHRRILIAKESPHAGLFVRRHRRETLLRHLLILFHKRLRDHEVLHTVLTGIGEMLGAYHTVFLHRVAHLEGRVDKDAVVAVEHLGIHAAHRGADDEIGMFFVAGLPQEAERLLRTDGEVWRNDCGIGEHLTDTGDGTRLP